MPNLLKKGLFGVQDLATRVIYGKEQMTTKASFYSLVDRLIDGTEKSMKDYEGDVLLVVNVASK